MYEHWGKAGQGFSDMLGKVRYILSPLCCPTITSPSELDTVGTDFSPKSELYKETVRQQPATRLALNSSCFKLWSWPHPSFSSSLSFRINRDEARKMECLLKQRRSQWSCTSGRPCRERKLSGPGSLRCRRSTEAWDCWKQSFHWTPELGRERGRALRGGDNDKQGRT